MARPTCMLASPKKRPSTGSACLLGVGGPQLISYLYPKHALGRIMAAEWCSFSGEWSSVPFWTRSAIDSGIGEPGRAASQNRAAGVPWAEWPCAVAATAISKTSSSSLAEEAMACDSAA
jgi:hypothetical protein